MNPKAPHRFSHPTTNFFEQLNNPSGSLDPAYSQVQNGININHGWKIHADLVTDLSKDEGLAKMGRGADLSIIDQDLADAFDQRLGKLGLNFDDFYRFYGSARQMHGEPGLPGYGPKYADPNDILSTVEVFDRNKAQYKIGIGRYGEGRHITSYAQNIVDRDKLIADLENTLGDRLVDQNDPAYRLPLTNTGNKNAPLSRGVSGRFTTDYLPDPDPVTGKINFAEASSDWDLIDDTYRVTGEINEEQVKRIEKLATDVPEMKELLYGPEGYQTPYKSIDDIIYERQHGLIAPTKKPGFDIFSTETPTVTTGPTPGAVPPTPTVTTGPTPGKPLSGPTVTTGPTPGAVPPTPTVTTGPTPPKKPIGRPVISANTTAPTPTAAGAQQTAQATTQSGNATPPPRATIHSNAPTPPRPSSGAPAKAPGKMRALADDVSAAVTQGPNGARNLKMLGIAGALGVAGFGLSRGARSVQDENETNKRLEMQRRGII